MAYIPTPQYSGRRGSIMKRWFRSQLNERYTMKFHHLLLLLAGTISFSVGIGAILVLYTTHWTTSGVLSITVAGLCLTIKGALAIDKYRKGRLIIREVGKVTFIEEVD